MEKQKTENNKRQTSNVKRQTTNQQTNNIDSLYFIALVPHHSLRIRVKQLKEEMKLRFGASHALKAPAHITMQMPFRRNETEESDIENLLGDLVSDQLTFKVELNGFDSFPPRVIFLRIADHDPIRELRSGLSDALSSKLNYIYKELHYPFHPHMTIATRDLSEEAFNRAWPEYKERNFTDSFEANSICLLKHNGSSWDVFKEFPFKG